MKFFGNIVTRVALRKHKWSFVCYWLIVVETHGNFNRKLAKNDQNQYVIVPTAKYTLSSIKKNSKDLNDSYNSKDHSFKLWNFPFYITKYSMIWNSQMRTEKDSTDSFFRQNVATIHKYRRQNSNFWHQYFSSRKKDFLLYSWRPKETKNKNYCQMLHVVWAMLVKFSSEKNCLLWLPLHRRERECLAAKYNTSCFFTLLGIGNGHTCRQTKWTVRRKIFCSK